MPGTPRTFEVIAAEVIAAGVTDVFGLMGEDTAKLVTTLAADPAVNYHGARHESMAVAMADGYARASGRLGVAVLSRGPGLVNGLTAAVAARKHGTPLLIVTGDSPTGQRLARIGQRYPKHVPQTALVEACGLRAVEVPGPEGGYAAIRQAITLAREGHAVCLNVPTDLFDTAISGPAQPEAGGGRQRRVAEPAEARLRALADLLDASERPLLLAGRGVWDGAHGPGADAACADLLRRLAERCGALLGTTLLAKDLFAGDAFDVGIVGGFAGEATRSLLAERDLVVAFGAGLNTFTTGGGELFPKAQLVRVDHDEDALAAGPPLTLGLPGDATATARALCRMVRHAPQRRTAEERELLRADRRREDFVDASVPGALDPRWLFRSLNELLPADRSLVLDAGAFIGFASRYLSVPHPGRFSFCLDFSAVGLGHGTALGVAAARPGSTTVLCIGDGGLLLTLGELETAVRRGLPLVVLVLDDGAYGAERHYLDLVGMDNSESRFGRVAFARIAEALGMATATVSAPADLASASALLAERTGPVLIDCKINGEVRPTWIEELFAGNAYGR